VSDFYVTATVYGIKNGAKIKAETDLTAATTNWAVKNSSGSNVDNTNSQAWTVSGGALQITPVAVTSGGITSSNPGYSKVLSAGTYYITATFTVGKNTVNVNNSFKITDSQDTSVGVTVKNNDLSNKGTALSLASAFANPAYVQFTYDGQNVSVIVAKVNATTATNSSYVKSVDLYVPVTGSNTIYVKVNVPINQSFTNVGTN